jgi:hypothetical protein
MRFKIKRYDLTSILPRKSRNNIFRVIYMKDKRTYEGFFHDQLRSFLCIRYGFGEDLFLGHQNIVYQ